MLTCKSCGISKPGTDFYESNRARCKECVKASARSNRAENIEQRREYDRARAKHPHRMAANRENSAEYRRQFPERYRANNAVYAAVRDGRLHKLPCEHCGALDVEAHHPDYSRPLSVVWLCPPDHKAIHLAYPDDYYD